MEKEEENFDNEWARTQLSFPVDDFDEDDEIDERIAEAERKKNGHVTRGGFFCTQ
jgi:hypothetical protein